MNKKKILITGVAGLLGSRLAGYILDNYPDIEVHGIDDLSGGYLDNVPKKVYFTQYNLTNNIDWLFRDVKFDYVFHFAAYAAEGLSPFIRRFNYSNNLLATANIINNCINYGVKRLVFTSSMAVYGHGEFGIFDESLIPKPIDPYGIAKYACEMDIQVAGIQHGLDWCIIRPHNVYGINQNIWDRYRNVLGIWMNLHLQGKPLNIYGSGIQTRAFTYIDDILKPLYGACIIEGASKQIINLGGIEEITINSACDTLLDVMGSGEKIYLEGRHEVSYAVPTFQKSIDILDYEYKTPLKLGLQQMWNWAKIQPNKPSLLLNNYEIEKGIYKFWKK